jgi:hypothetical protein
LDSHKNHKKNKETMSTQKLEELVARLEAVTAKLEKKAGGSTSAPTNVVDEEASEAVTAYEAWESEFLAPFLADAKALTDAKEGVQLSFFNTTGCFI